MGVRRLIMMFVVAAAVLTGCGGGSKAPSRTTSSAPVVDTASAPVHKHQLPRAPTGPRDAPVPILMYHVIARPPRGTPYPELWVSPASFARQVSALAHAGYHATTLDTVWRAWHRHGAMPRRPIVVSFDDGYQSQSTRARRMLDRLHWPGVLNLAVKNVGVAGGLTRGEVRAMIHDGWEIDAHTISHLDLTTLDAARLTHEVAGSRAWLRHAFKAPVDFFCYPAGRYNLGVEAAVRAAGYHGATTEDPGIAAHNEDPFALPRMRVTASMSAATLVATVRRIDTATSARPS